MSAPEFPVIETSGGDRPPNTVAERGGIALAVVALAGGLLIALGNLLGSDAGPSASASPVAQATPRPTPRATPDSGPREIILVAGTPPSAAPSGSAPWQFSGWIRAVVDQPLWTSPDSDRAETTELLHAGEIRFAEEVPEEPGWLQLSGDGGPRGFVVMADGETALVQRIMPEPYLASAEVWTLTAGPNGFVATATLPTVSDRGSPTLTAYSSDGAAWQIVDLPISVVTSVAWGPAGWLAVGWVGEMTATPATWVFRSDDGVHWNSLGTAPGLDYAGQLVGSESGYLMQASGSGYAEWSEWFSSDGLAWTESDDGLLGGSTMGPYPRVAAVGSGFYAWNEDELPAGVAGHAFTADGRTWTFADEDAPAGLNLKITSVGSRLIAAVTDAVDGTVRFRTATVDGPTLTWDPYRGTETEFSGLGVASLVSDGRRVVAILWERTTDALVAYSSLDGQTWAPTALPAAGFGGIPRLVAGGPAGMVVVGSRQTSRGSNPIFWHDAPDGRWTAEPSPIFPLVPGPSADDCPGPLVDVVDFLVVDPATAVACFADTPATFRAWSVGCPDCQPESSLQYEPEWLANPTTHVLYLQPIQSGAGGWRGVKTAPNMALDPAWTQSWIEVTGHFDDPAAASCRWTPSVAEESYYAGQFWFVEGCRTQFVVTEVRVVDGP